jgi:hypothetical protein
MFDISRGFWRWSLVVGTCSFVATLLWFAAQQGIGGLAILSDFSFVNWLRLIGWVGVLPAVLAGLETIEL